MSRPPRSFQVLAALDPRERKKLGAEFTPRRWVERLVMPAV